jgi:hypothetical protein
MTSLITSGNVASAAWIAVVWLFVIAVIGSILLARWLRREHEDAAKTDAVMESLLSDHTNDHIWDA